MSISISIDSTPSSGWLEVGLYNDHPTLKELQLSIPYGKVESGTAKLVQCNLQTDKRDLDETGPLTIDEHKAQYLVESVNFKFQMNRETSFLTLQGTVPLHPTYSSFLHCMVKNSKDLKLTANPWDMKKDVKVTSGGAAVDVKEIDYFWTTRMPRISHFVPTVNGPFSVTVYNVAAKAAVHSMRFLTFITDETMEDTVTDRWVSAKCTLHTRDTEDSPEVERRTDMVGDFKFTKSFETEVRLYDDYNESGVYSARYSCPSVVLKSHFPGTHDFVTMIVHEDERHSNLLADYEAFVRRDGEDDGDGEGDGEGEGDDDGDGNSTNGFEGAGMARASLFSIGVGLVALVATFVL